MDYLCLILVPVLLSVGQVLFKKTVQTPVTHSLAGFLGSLLGSPYFWAALLIYGVATLLWLFVLSRVPLSRAMPFVALTFVIVPAGSAVLFGERLNLMYWIGVSVIVVGISISVAARPPA